MDNDDLRRRLEKLTALKEHPSTLPAIREEAARAEERLRTHMNGTRAEPPPGYFRRYPFKPSPIQERTLREMDRWTAEVEFPWAGIVGVDR